VIELSSTERDILIILAGIGPADGAAVTEELDSYYYSSFARQQVYNGLDSLIDEGFVSKETESRPNTYSITTEGRDVLDAHNAWKDGI
jgi:DNA-binding PadR family transcriptional regulator